MSARARSLLRALADSAPALAWRRRRYDRLFESATDMALWRGAYASFAEAAAAAPRTRPLGYDNPAPAQMYRGAYLERVFPRDYPVLFWLRRLMAAGASDVFDFGGHVGTKFYAYRRYLEHPLGLRWTVYDVPAVRQAGAALAAQRGDAQALRFADSPAAASGCDVLLAIGSLQYVETTLGSLLRDLPQRPAHVLVNEFTAYPGRSVVTLQSVGTAFCPYKFVNRDEFVQDVLAAGYALVDSWSNPEKSCRVPFEPGLVIEAQQGFYFRRT